MTMTPGKPALFDEGAGMPRGEATKVSENVAEAREIDEVSTAVKVANAAENIGGFPVLKADGQADGQAS